VECFFGVPSDPDEFSLIGTEGILQVSPLNGGQLHWHSGSDHVVEEHPAAANFNSPLIADFVAAIRDDRPPEVSGEEGRLTNEVLERAYNDE